MTPSALSTSRVSVLLDQNSTHFCSLFWPVFDDTEIATIWVFVGADPAATLSSVGSGQCPMSAAFRVGDRVRLITSRLMGEFRTGDEGSVLRVMPARTGELRIIIQVRMDRGGRTLYPTFYADELEKVT